MKKNYILIWLAIFLSWWLLYLFFIWSTEQNKLNNQKKQALENFNSTYTYINNKYKSNFPLPEWDLILLNKKWEMLHLEDRSIPLDKVKDLYVIQWTTCSILKNDKNFQKINYDTRYSIIKDGKPLFKKCFTYSVTKDRKYFQIWSISEDSISPILKGNMKQSITKAYDAPVLVKADTNDFLPYAPNKVSPIFQIKNLWNSKLTLSVEDDENNIEKKLQNWNNIILTGDVNWVYQISLKWKIDKNTIVKFIDTNGSIVYIKWNDNENINFQLKDYQIDTNRIDYIVETGRFLANIVKLSPEKNMEVEKSGTTLVIRWTKFSIDSTKDNMSTDLLLWKILQRIDNWEKLTLDMENSFTSLFGNKLLSNIEKLKQLVSFIVYNDVFTHPKYKFEVGKFTLPTDILSGTKNIVNIDYENWEKISLFVIKKNEFNSLVSKNVNKEELEKNCNGKTGCIKVQQYENIVNNVCKKWNLWQWLDISKMYYLLDNTDDYKQFKLKKEIENKLDSENYILLTSRLGGANGNKNISTRISYISKWKITDVSLPRIKYQKNLKNIIFVCER
jgi:hypothetical protein